MRQLLASLAFFALFSSSLEADVFLSATRFRANELPVVYTNDAMPQHYKLRVKILGVPGYGDGFHAGTTLNNNYLKLDSVPAPGNYDTYVYWLKYDASGTSIEEIGPDSHVWLQILPADTAAPSVPGNLSVANVRSSTLTLKWTASTDNVGVTGYEVRRGGAATGLVTHTTAELTGLTGNTTYQFEVRARDEAGNWSAWSAPMSVTTLQPSADVVISAMTFLYTGNEPQRYYAPPGTNYVVIKAWGAGGGGYRCGHEGRTYQGGNGGFIAAKFNVSPGEEILVSVGGGGAGRGFSANAAQSSSGIYLAGGWPGGGGSYYSASGAGYSKVTTTSGALWVGGGGGASYWGSGGDGGGKFQDFGTSYNYTGQGADAASGGSVAGGKGGTEQAGGVGAVDGASGQGGSPPLNGGYIWTGGGGGGGYYGGGSGRDYAYGSPIYYAYGGAGGGGGSSYAVRPAYGVQFRGLNTTDPHYPGGGVSLGGTTGNGGNGAVVILAYQTTNGAAATTYTYNQLPSYTMPATYIAPQNAAFIAVKMWGGGGPGCTNTSNTTIKTNGGAGAYTVAVFGGLAYPSSVAINLMQPVPSTWNIGGFATSATFGSTRIIAGGGGMGGTAPIGHGGAGGAPNGQNGGPGQGNSGGFGATTSSGGAGGAGNGYDYEYDSEGNPTGTFNVGNGEAGGSFDGSSGRGGYPGSVGINGSTGGNYRGGAGGYGYHGGGAGGSGDNALGGGGGGGGSSHVLIVDRTPLFTAMSGSAGAVAPNPTDPNYPGENVGYGGANGGNGNSGAVVIIAYPANGTSPTITSPPATSFARTQPVDYRISGTHDPLMFTATGLPPGLTLDQVTGQISGSPTTQGAFTSTITARNPYGTGQATLNWTIVAPDSVAPSSPTNIQAVNVGLDSFTLTWAAATDNVALYLYEVQRDGVSLGTVSSTSMSVTGLVAQIAYTLKVRSRDTAGNWSPWSSPITVTPTDGLPPSAPTGLNYAEKTATTVTLLWNAANDNVGVTSYLVFRGGAQVGATTDLVFADRGLTASTAYSYTVKAMDAAGNISAASAAFSVTTTADFSADGDSDGIPNTTETALGTSNSSAATPDASNQTPLNVHRPIRNP